MAKAPQTTPVDFISIKRRHRRQIEDEVRRQITPDKILMDGGITETCARIKECLVGKSLPVAEVTHDTNGGLYLIVRSTVTKKPVETKIMIMEQQNG